MLKFVEFINEEQETDEAWSRISRIKQGRNLKKRRARLKVGRERQARKIADPGRIKRRAQKQARAKERKDFTITAAVKSINQPATQNTSWHTTEWEDRRCRSCRCC